MAEGHPQGDMSGAKESTFVAKSSDVSIS